MERPSISKADNINSFLDFYLNKLKRSYDYLMICDADVAINKNFIKSNINFFYSKAFKNLGAITSQILQYKIDNVFANLNRLYLQNSLAYQNIQGSFDAKNGMQCFAGACMILKKEMLDDLSNGFFPNEVDEDFYLSVYCAKRS